MFKDPYGLVSIGTSVACDAATGRAFAYVAEPRFDYTMSGGGVTPRAFPDAEGGPVRSALNWYNVLDYPSIQAAIDAVPAEGGVVYVPASSTPYSTSTIPSYTPPIRLPANRAITLRGDGPYTSILKSNSTTADMIHMAGDWQTVENLMLWGPASVGAGRGIRVWRDADYFIPDYGTAENISYRTTIRDCHIVDTASWGVYIDTLVRPGKATSNHSVIGAMERVEIRRNRTNGQVYSAPPPDNAGTGGGNPTIGGDHTAWLLLACHFRDMTGYGLRARLARGLTMIGCVFESGVDTSAPFVSLESCSDIRIQSGWFEGRANRLIGSGAEQYLSPNTFFIEMSRANDPRFPGNYGNIMIDGCLFHRAAGQGGVAKLNPRLVFIGATARSITLLGNRTSQGGTLKDFVDSDLDSDSIRIEEDAQVTILGGTMFQGDPLPTRPLQVREVSSGGKSSLLQAHWNLRVPKITSADYTNELNHVAREGDVVYDVALHALRICTGFSGATPPTPIWKTVQVS